MHYSWRSCSHHQGGVLPHSKQFTSATAAKYEQAVAQHHQAAVDARTSVGRDDSLDCPENQNLKKPDKVI